MKRLIWWLAGRFGVTRDSMKMGYEWGWRAARAHPEMDDMYVRAEVE